MTEAEFKEVSISTTNQVSINLVNVPHRLSPPCDQTWKPERSAGFLLLRVTFPARFRLEADSDRHEFRLLTNHCRRIGKSLE